MQKTKNCLNCYWYATSDNPRGFECRQESSTFYGLGCSNNNTCEFWTEVTYFDEGKGRMMSPLIAKERLDAGYKVVFLLK